MPNENAEPKLTKHAYGKLVRQKFLNLIKDEWGDYKSLNGYLYKFNNGYKILTVYSSLNNDRWWYGVSERYWSSWDAMTCLAMLMRDGNKCEFVLLNPRQSKELLDRIDPVKDNQKKINVRIPSLGKIYIQEWQEFPFEKKTINIGMIDKNDSFANSHQVPFERNRKILIATIKKAFDSCSKEEKQIFIRELLGS